MARPPVPVAWKTSGSTSSPSRSVTAVTHGVVTPNIVSPTAGRSAAAGIGIATIPASACAALPSTCREIRFSPATSVTEYSIAMSDAPTYAATLPEATVDTITLATPTGSARMAGVISAVPPEPPSPSTPPTSVRASRNRSRATAIADTAEPGPR